MAEIKEDNIGKVVRKQSSLHTIVTWYIHFGKQLYIVSTKTTYIYIPFDSAIPLSLCMYIYTYINIGMEICILFV